MITQWKRIEHSNAYSVSDDGMVRNDRNSRILNPPIMKNGYRCACLSISGKRKFVYVHRLVAMAFAPGFRDGLHVNHIDGNKLNNRYSNLEWCTQAENNAHARRSGLHKPHTNAVEKMNLATRKPVAQIDLETGDTLKVHISLSQARRDTGISSIHDCLSGRQRTAGGFGWKYTNTDK